ncbi:Alpha-2-MRAP-C domain-containing protein [Aphelenchoides besseyi]|nr:Alpha-2-MRAP-C domain-containing protein [Aphelenchoides besseyi]KAI6200040.1 Alpha-2-MRAP-C domain-containing protein [Aphelenchoides besseyi]
MHIWFLVLLHHVLLLSSNAVETKSEEDKYRMEKINFVWSKATARVQDPNVVEKIAKELKKFDDLYLSLKQTVDHQKFKSKDLNEVDAKLERMLERYDLADVARAFNTKYKHEKDLSSTSRKDEPNFVDERVIKIWNEVKENLSSDDLEDVRNQLLEQDERCAVYETLLRRHKQLDDNHIRPHDEHTNSTSEVKQLNAQIENAFQILKQKVDEIRSIPFSNTRVRELWNKARKSKRLIPNELDVIKTELRHLDREWEKVNHHSEHLDEHENILKSMGESDPDERSVQMKERQDKMFRKLKKLEAYLEEKLTPHSEL